MKRDRKNDIFVGAIGLISLIYIFNPGAGFFELIPDNVPFIGNLDEAGASALVISALQYFGFGGVGAMFGRPGSGGPKIREM